MTTIKVVGLEDAAHLLADNTPEDATRPLPAASTKDPKMAPEYTFNFAYPEDNPRWKGRFTSRVPSVKDRRIIGLLRAKLADHTPFEALDPATREMCFVLATLSVVLDVKSHNPEGHWSHLLESVDDEEVIYALYEEVASHHATFRKSRQAP